MDPKKDFNQINVKKLVVTTWPSYPKSRNIPYILDLTPFEILYGRPPPLLPNFQSENFAAYDQKILKTVKALYKT